LTTTVFHALESLPDTEVNVEITGVPWHKHLIWRSSLKTRECRRIQVVSQVESYRPNRSLVAYPNPDRVRYVIKVTLFTGTLLQAQFWRLLMPPQQVVQHVVPGIEDVSGIVKHGKTQISLKES